jgi:hypothetical protein
MYSRQATNGNLDHDLTAVILWTVRLYISVPSPKCYPNRSKDAQRKIDKTETEASETITDIVSPPMGTGFGI